MPDPSQDPKPNPPLDREAKRRLAVIRHVEEATGNVSMTCRYFSITRQAYYVWYRCYQAEGVEGLRTRSDTRPTMTGEPVHPNEWQQCVNDWQDALTELVTARSQAFKRYAFLLCGNDAQAQDLIQDALVRTFSRTRPFTDVSGAEHYVRATILTLYLDQQRRHTT